MHPLLRVPYAALGAVAELAVALAPGGRAKWRRALRGRKGLGDRLRAFAPKRDASRALAWFHAPSVGEALQALPVVQRLRARAESPQIAVTWFSPSVEAFAQRFDADYRDYLAFDTPRGADRALDALQPTALVFSKLDVWPVLTARAKARHVRVGMISATLSAGSTRRSRAARLLLADAYAQLDLVGAITADDAERLADLGVRRDVIRVTGDTGCDQAWERARRADPTRPPLSELASNRPTLVAGSTWPADERHLTAAWERIARAVPQARLIVAPHEPTPLHTEPLRAWAKRAGLRASLMGADDARDADVVVVDRVGVLAELYALGRVAFVGGGFHRFGLHSVIEPAAAGLPVLHGPAWRDSPAAGRLIAAGGGRPVADGAELGAVAAAWLADPAASADPAARAKQFVQAHLGAAERSLALVDELCGQRDQAVKSSTSI